MPFHVTPRKWWTTVDPKYAVSYDAPASLVFFSQTKARSCRTSYYCVQEARRLQERHMTKGSVDVVYNFLIGGNGEVFEGRGWYNVPKLHFKHNRHARNSIHIAFMGDFSGSPPPEIMYQAANQLITLGVMKRFINEKFLLITSRMIPPDIESLAPFLEDLTDQKYAHTYETSTLEPQG